MIGKQIKRVEDIIKLSKQGKCVYNLRKRKHMPASWLENYPAKMLYGMIKAGHLRSYTPKSK